MSSPNKIGSFIFIFIFSAVLNVPEISAYKPVIIIHGILDGASDLTELKRYIQKSHPGTEVTLVDLFDDYESFAPLWQQVEAIRNVTMEIMRNATDGVHIIGYSQGGIVARGLIQTTNDHNVDTFIALSSPLNGQYGDTSWFNWLFPYKLKEEMYKFFYTTYGQKWSVANYWKDPHEADMYQQYSDYLAHLNNESLQKGHKYEYNSQWRTNFARLKKLVLVGGPHDGVIMPWQSALFGSYDKNDKIVPMRNQTIYKNDVIGLRKLDKRRSLIECVKPDITHLYWHKDPRVYQDCIEKHLR